MIVRMLNRDISDMELTLSAGGKPPINTHNVVKIHLWIQVRSATLKVAER